MEQIYQLVNETAKQIAKHNRNDRGESWLIIAKNLNDEIDEYLKIIKQIAIMRASKEINNGLDERY
jgi:hypothetical protein